MYAICNVTYGVPLNTNESNHTQSELIAQCVSDEVPGFMGYYSGAGVDYIPSRFGIELGEFDECCHHTDISTLQLSPTAEQVAEYKRLYEALEPEVKKELEVYGEPRVFILWSTS